MTTGDTRNSPYRDARFLAAVAIAFLVLLVLAGRTIPIVVWDEGRIVVNAMEMRHSGEWLVATYDRHPDLWNTKPPLLLWLLNASMAVFGPTEFAVRLPSLAGALGTIVLTMVFLRRIAGSAGIAAFGGVALAASIGFFGEHGARTADYDALLCFFTTAYLMLLFFAVHRRRPAWRPLLLAAAMGACALMLKGIAGGVPGAGLLLYLLVTHRWPRLLATPRYLVAAALAAVPVLAFLVLRESAAPGYLGAMFYNDIGGRVSEALDDHSGPPWYYLDDTFARGLFSLGIVTLAAPLALTIARGRVRLALVFALCIALGQLVVVSMSSTKLTHYYLSAYPFVAIAAALAAHALLGRLRALAAAGTVSPLSLSFARLMPALLLVSGIAHAAEAQRSVLAPREHYPRTRYGMLLDALAGERGPVLLIDHGLVIPDDPHYAPELRFHAMVARERGRRIAQVGSIDQLAAIPAGTIIATCDPALAAAVRDRAGNALFERDACLAGRITVPARYAAR